MHLWGYRPSTTNTHKTDSDLHESSLLLLTIWFLSLCLHPVPSSPPVFTSVKPWGLHGNKLWFSQQRCRDKVEQDRQKWDESRKPWWKHIVGCFLMCLGQNAATSNSSLRLATSGDKLLWELCFLFNCHYSQCSIDRNWQ